MRAHFGLQFCDVAGVGTRGRRRSFSMASAMAARSWRGCGTCCSNPDAYGRGRPNGESRRAVEHAGRRTARQHQCRQQVVVVEFRQAGGQGRLTSVGERLCLLARPGKLPGCHLGRRRWRLRTLSGRRRKYTVASAATSNWRSGSPMRSARAYSAADCLSPHSDVRCRRVGAVRRRTGCRRRCSRPHGSAQPPGRISRSIRRLPPGYQPSTGPAIKFLSGFPDRSGDRTAWSPTSLSDMPVGETWEGGDGRRGDNQPACLTVFSGGAAAQACLDIAPPTARRCWVDT